MTSGAATPLTLRLCVGAKAATLQATPEEDLPVRGAKARVKAKAFSGALKRLFPGQIRSSLLTRAAITLGFIAAHVYVNDTFGAKGCAFRGRPLYNASTDRPHGVVRLTVWERACACVA